MIERAAPRRPRRLHRDPFVRRSRVGGRRGSRSPLWPRCSPAPSGTVAAAELRRRSPLRRDARARRSARRGPAGPVPVAGSGARPRARWPACGAVPRRAGHRRSRLGARRPRHAAQRLGVLVRSVPCGVARAGRATRPGRARCPCWASTPRRPRRRTPPAHRPRGQLAVGHRSGRASAGAAASRRPAVSYVVRADGSVARVDPPVPFDTADEVAAAVERLT